MRASLGHNSDAMPKQELTYLACVMGVDTGLSDNQLLCKCERCYNLAFTGLLVFGPCDGKDNLR